MMFECLGDQEGVAAEDLRTAVEAQLADGTAPRTPDLGGNDRRYCY